MSKSTFDKYLIAELSLSKSDDRTIIRATTGAGGTTISSSKSDNTIIYGAMTCARAICPRATNVVATCTRTTRTGAARARGGSGSDGTGVAPSCRITTC